LIRIVAPFRPFPPEAPHHLEQPSFDWIGAIRMLSHSTRVACGVDVQVITDVDTSLPVPMLQYHTTHRRLMLWYLEVACCYLESPDFDRDTVMLDSDQLVFGDLRAYFRSSIDLAILIRPQLPKDDPASLPILNGVQFWGYRAQTRLAAFYRQALDIAVSLPDDQLVWGADTTALARLLAPLEINAVVNRCGLRIWMMNSDKLLRALNRADLRQLHKGRAPCPLPAVLDFRWTRKPFMRPVYEQTIAGVPV